MTIPSLVPVSVGMPACQRFEFPVDVGASAAGRVQICNRATATSDEWTSLQGRDLEPIPSCDLTALWNPDLDVYLPDIAVAPASIDDPETGVLTDPSKPLVFCQVTGPADPNGVRCVKSTAGKSVTISC